MREPDKVTRMRKFYSIRDKEIIDYIDALKNEVNRLRAEVRKLEKQQL